MEPLCLPLPRSIVTLQRRTAVDLLSQRPKHLLLFAA